MAKHRYKILSDSGDILPLQALAEGTVLEKDAEVELDLSREQRTAVVAAGWVEALDDDEEDSKADSKATPKK